MGWRTIEISNPAELHIKNGQLQIEQESHKVMIPIEDISNIFCIGPGIRISTMALSLLSQHKIAITTGIHHNNQLNAFNLSDDLIEPWRPMVDLSAYLKHGNSIVLSKTERKEAAGILHNLCVINNKKMTILSAIDIMCESLKRYYKSYSELEIHLPEVIAVEKMESHIREKTCLHGCLFHFQHLPC